MTVHRKIHGFPKVLVAAADILFMNINKTSIANPAPVAIDKARVEARRNERSAAGDAARAEKASAVAKEEVSFSKVAQMRAAIEAGTFKIDPDKILDGMAKRGDLS